MMKLLAILSIVTVGAETRAEIESAMRHAGLLN